jgi:hypothetical protein
MLAGEFEGDFGFVERGVGHGGEEARTCGTDGA